MPEENMIYRCPCLTCQIARGMNSHLDDLTYYDFLHAYLDLEDWMYRPGCTCHRCVDVKSALAVQVRDTKGE